MILWTVVHRAPLSLEFSRQEYWSGLPFPPPGDLPDPEIKLALLEAPVLVGKFFTPEPPAAAATAQERGSCDVCDGTGAQWRGATPFQGKEQGLCFDGAAVKRHPTSKIREAQDSRCCKKASEGRHTETIITENKPI